MVSVCTTSDINLSNLLLPVLKYFTTTYLHSSNSSLFNISREAGFSSLITWKFVRSKLHFFISAQVLALSETGPVFSFSTCRCVGGRFGDCEIIEGLLASHYYHLF